MWSILRFDRELPGYFARRSVRTHALEREEHTVTVTPEHYSATSLFEPRLRWN